jgi:hypothetical protein
LDSLADVFHSFLDRFALGVATREDRTKDVVTAFLFPFENDREAAFHAAPQLTFILTCSGKE